VVSNFSLSVLSLLRRPERTVSPAWRHAGQTPRPRLPPPRLAATSCAPASLACAARSPSSRCALPCFSSDSRCHFFRCMGDGGLGWGGVVVQKDSALTAAQYQAPESRVASLNAVITRCRSDLDTLQPLDVSAAAPSHGSTAPEASQASLTVAPLVSGYSTTFASSVTSTPGSIPHPAAETNAFFNSPRLLQEVHTTGFASVGEPAVYLP
jgi:hypothetical protein